MRLNDLYENVLLELDWRDTSKLADVLSRLENINRWVHFSRIDKLGVNPKKAHNDPYGIYFFPIKWLISNERLMTTGDHYFLRHFPYYFICDIDLSGPGVVMSDLTEDRVISIAKKNGWYEALEDYVSETPTKRLGAFHKGAPGLFWGVVNRLVDNHQITWNAAYKGLDYIYDDNTSTIHSNEPEQLLVLNPRIIKLVEKGHSDKNTDMYDRTFEAWKRPYVKLFNMIAQRFSGDVYWKSKVLNVSFVITDHHFRIYTDRNSSALWLEYKFKRSIAYTRIDDVDLEELSYERAIELLNSNYVIPLCERTSDLLWKPFIQEKIFENYAENIIGNGGFTHDIQIENDSYKAGGYDRRNISFSAPENINYRLNVIRDTLQKIQQIGPLRVQTKIFAYNYPHCSIISFDVRVNDESVMSVNLNVGDYETKETPSERMKSTIEDALEVLDEHHHWFKEKWGYRQGYMARKYLSDDLIEPFYGWLVLNSGLSLGGKLRTHFADAVAAYEAYPNKHVLLNDIAYVTTDHSKYKGGR